MRKNYTLLFIILLVSCYGYAQSLAINATGSAPHPNAILDIQSADKGILIPRMSTAARMQIPATKGMLVYDTTTDMFYYNTGTEWKTIAAGTALSATGAWLLNGNAGTDGSNFLGTTDNVPLKIRVNNIPSGLIDHINNNIYWGIETDPKGVFWFPVVLWSNELEPAAVLLYPAVLRSSALCPTAVLANPLLA